MSLVALGKDGRQGSYIYIIPSVQLSLLGSRVGLGLISEGKLGLVLEQWGTGVKGDPQATSQPFLL